MYNRALGHAVCEFCDNFAFIKLLSTLEIFKNNNFIFMCFLSRILK